MALMRASSTGLLVLCIASLLLVSSIAAETTGAPVHDAGGRKVMKRVLLSADDTTPPQIQTYPTSPQPPTYYGPPQQRP
ncbi:unnamed protein product [Urochloa decumbens]|uniref:Uncharacterized protein n=1 Tax=Urochloa decumbens TaxID=240449 RepID=A0ABC9BA74_9POAL